MAFVTGLPRPVAIIGLGVSGRAALRLLLAAGVPQAEVVTFDTQDPSADHSRGEALLQDCRPGTLVVSPGLPLSTPWIRDFPGRVTSELELACSFLQSERCICVTGSIGKSTVTSLIGVGARAVDPAAFVGGNLGTPLAEYICGVLQGQSRARWVVLELSSYNLENCRGLSSEFSVFTYLTPNHLERYASLQDYYATKFRLIEQTTGALILNSNGGDLRAVFPGSQLATHWEDRLTLPPGLRSSLLVGDFHQDNLALAGRVSELAGWGEESLAAMSAFPGLAHRLENLGTFHGVRFINDSKATTMESVLSAVKTVSLSCKSPHRLWVLLGGHDKNLPWEELQTLRNSQIVRPLYFGEYAHGAHARVGVDGPLFPSLRAALADFRKFVKPGDTLLLSPGGTSHDEFRNFEERGTFFAEQVRIFARPNG